MHALELRIPPPLVSLAAAAGMGLAAWGLPALAVHYPWRMPAAIACALAGIGVILAGIASFRRARTTVNPLKPETSSTIVCNGIYGHTRNPMYLGMLLMLAAWGIWLSHPPSWLFLPAFVAYLNRFQIGPEERALSTKFGAPYGDYLRNVRRWL